MDNKKIIVINGKGGTGKDTLCNSLLGKYKLMNISAIDPIKEIARNYGWNGEKDDSSRRFLAELKKAFANYNDLPTKYLLIKTKEFLSSDAEILFVHIREADQINQYKEAIFPVQCITLLVTREEIDRKHHYGNTADDDVFNYTYDFIFENDASIAESREQFLSFIKNIFTV